MTKRMFVSSALTLMFCSLLQEATDFRYGHQATKESMSSVEEQLVSASESLYSLAHSHPLNDSFYISYDAHFGTINGFRLGTLPIEPVAWDEINAGIICLTLSSIF